MPWQHSIKKPKTHRYPSLKGTDPKFRRNHRHALHGTMRALVRNDNPRRYRNRPANNHTEGGQGGQARLSIKDDTITSEQRWRFSIPL
jgi:hypothetical protein